MAETRCNIKDVTRQHLQVISYTSSREVLVRLAAYLTGGAKPFHARISIQPDVYLSGDRRGQPGDGLHVQVRADNLPEAACWQFTNPLVYTFGGEGYSPIIMTLSRALAE
jgi:hypothetical protein